MQHCHPIHKDNKVTGIFNYLEGLLKCQNHSGVLTKVYQVQLIKSGERGGTHFCKGINSCKGFTKWYIHLYIIIVRVQRYNWSNLAKGEELIFVREITHVNGSLNDVHNY